MDTNTICDFGLHKGERYTELPISFLNWMIAANHHHAPLAMAEVERRMAAVERVCPENQEF
ncbi:hypothetical protein ACFOEE_15150 [Pseudoalteromonas fenneropenaei]|uniref:Uncharacterized protein n=1 Tax=Pseudoalteromonas fenneropenaei TaxID=1737459 RepID=A0ABV7CMU7_9GAMM